MMHIGQQNRIAAGANLKLGMVYHMKNGGEIIPLAVWERAFDGAILIHYKARGRLDKEWAEGDSTAATIASQIF